MAESSRTPPGIDWRFGADQEYESYAEQYGTPYFLYDADLVARRIDFVRSSFRKTAAVYFAVKANPNLKLLEFIRSSIDGLDISSAGELEQALLARYDPGVMSFAGPAKSTAELQRAIECEVGSISIESERELRDVIRIARSNDTKANILVRVNPATDHRAFGLKMGGRPLQFGIDEENIASVVQTIGKHRDCLQFLGVHVYAGSQGFEFAEMADSFRHTLSIAEQVEKLSGLELKKVNLGGGFGISHATPDKILDLPALADSVADDLERFSETRSCEIIFELGRYLVADAGIYVVRVIGTKESRGQFFAVTDGGLHHHLAAAGSFGVGFRSNYPAVNISRPDARTVHCNIAGPSCNPTDLLAQKSRIAQPREGDLIAVLSSGSYSMTASPILFLGRPTPAEIVRRNGQAVSGRLRHEITDFN